MHIGLSEQSFKHANVLSEQINFSAPGAPKSTIGVMKYPNTIIANLIPHQHDCHLVASSQSRTA